MGAVVPFWVDGEPNQARVRLIRGKTELLPAFDIVTKLDSAVNFGRNIFKVGQSEWEMMTSNEKHHFVFPLSPTACSYTKFHAYFSKLRGAK